jgi:predicted RNA methylase
MGSKWKNVDAGPRQVKDLLKAGSALRSEGQARDELYGVIGGQERRSTVIAMMGPVRPEVAALDEAIGEKYGHQITRANVRAIIAEYEAALPEACKSRPVDDNRRTPDEEAERSAAVEQASRDAQNAILTQVMAKAPAGAKAVIFAEYHEDNSDPMTDYFNSRITRTVAIGFRSSSREDFRALRSAAAQFPETAHMASDEALGEWQDAQGPRHYRLELEHRENYSMGGGNFLSDHGSSDSGTGWVVKSRDFPCTYAHLTEDAIPDKPEAPATAGSAASSPRSKAISADVMTVLASATADGNALRMTERLDRASYLAVNEVLAAAGGSWNRKARAHLFPGDAAEVLASLLDGGTITRPADEGYFPTPAPIVAFMIDLAGLEPGMEVLEPSAGDGAIARPVAERGCVVDCIELNPGRAEALRAAGFARNVSAGNFLGVPQLSPEHRAYDRVLMNPPFAGKADIAHVQHALGFLRPGGLLVAVMSAGVAFRDDRATAGFREMVTTSGGTIKPLPEGTFKEAGTGVRTVLVTLPVAAERSQAA